MRRVLLLSGPNLNLLGTREPQIYGSARLDDHVRAAVARAHELGLELDHLQSNSESELVAAIHGARTTHAAIVVNPGALTHYGWSLHDALAAFAGPVVELHISNLDRREAWRRISVVGPIADASIAGLGGDGYALAIDAVVSLLGRQRPR